MAGLRFGAHALVASMLGSACGASNGAAQPDCEAPDLIDDPVFDDDGGANQHHDVHHDARWRCEFMPDTPPDQSVSGDIAGLRRSVKHVFVLMLENRSFDQFLSQLPSVGVTDADVPTTETNPSNDGTPVPRYETPHLCLRDVSHEWLAAHAQFDNGLNDGFVATGGRRAMAFYGPVALPFHYYLAQTFALSDRYFSSVMGPTWPNHLFFWAGTSCGYAEDAQTNPGIISDCVLDTLRRRTIFGALGDQIDVFDSSGPLAVGVLTRVYPGIPKSIDAFHAAASLETDTYTALPPVVMLGATTKTVPFLGKTENDDHASVNIQRAQQFIFDAVSTITSRPALWQSSVIFVTYDENGGFYDHVPPPKACHPEPNPPPDAPRFDRLGFRVPLYVISPFVRRHYVSHYVTDHSSILRFIETWLDRPAFTKRDANAWAMLDFFDFDHPKVDVPPFDPANAIPTPAGLTECDATPDGFDE